MPDNLWDTTHASTLQSDLELRVYSGRLLGADPTLVLHGGGNTSVKSTITSIFGEPEDVLWVKGSGWDLKSIDAASLAPLRLADTARLAELPTLTDTAMVRQLKANCLDPMAPSPSVEAILHAVIPQKYVDHSHADAILTLTNSVGGETLLEELYGERVMILPYVMPGLDLAKQCREGLKNGLPDHVEGIILMHHGIFSFGDSAQQSYERMIDLVQVAEDCISRTELHWTFHGMTSESPDMLRAEQRASLRTSLCDVSGKPLVVRWGGAHMIKERLENPERRAAFERGPVTPDHVIRTKRVPMIGRDVDAFAASYRAYFDSHKDRHLGIQMLDPAPRVILDPELGLGSVGETMAQACAAEDIYLHIASVSWTMPPQWVAIAHCRNRPFLMSSTGN